MRKEFKLMSFVHCRAVPGIITIAVFTLVIILRIPCWSTDYDSIFTAANKLYEEEHYNEAIQSYQKIIDLGKIHHGWIYYNLGNCYYKKGEVGYAILNYEKSKKLVPTDEDIAINLRFARLQTIDKQHSSEPGVFIRFLWKTHNLFNINKTTFIISVLYFVLCGLLILRLFVAKRLKQAISALVAVIFIIIFLLGSSLLYRIYQNETKQYAIAISPVVSVRNAPEGDQVLFKVHEGLKFQIIRKHQNWCFVSLPNGNAGWVLEENLGEIF
ncbi:MAG: SH3 domain-containing protein [bacterium]